MDIHTIIAGFPITTPVTVTKANGKTITGIISNITDKSVVVDVDGKKNTVAIAHIDTIVNDTPATDDTELLTTAELAAIFDTNAKALRVELRRLGLGVGRGSRYGLPRTIVNTHGDAIRAGLAERSA